MPAVGRQLDHEPMAAFTITPSVALAISPAWQSVSPTFTRVEPVMRGSATEMRTKGDGHSPPCLKTGVSWPTIDER